MECMDKAEEVMWWEKRHAWRTEPCMPMPILRGISSYFWAMSSGAEDMRKAALDHFACYKTSHIADLSTLAPLCNSPPPARPQASCTKLRKIGERWTD